MIGERTATSVQLFWWQLDTSVFANSIERNTNKNGIWTVIQTFGVLQGFQQYTDTTVAP